MTNKQKIPKLRFPEFSGEWEERKIEDILTIGSGKDYKHLDKGNYPVYGTGGYMLSVSDYLYDGESVCIGRKGTIDKPRFLNGKFWTVDTLFYTHSFNYSLPKFVFYIFNNINWKKYNEASGVPSLSKNTLNKIIVNLPSLPEQEKIANFLSSVDKKIELLEEEKKNTEEYKKGVMQKIFSQELRFKDENGDDFGEWNIEKLGTILNEYVEKSTINNQYEALSSTSNGLYLQSEYFNRQIASKDNIGYKVLQLNQVVLSPQNLWLGNINLNIKYDIGIVSPSYKIFNINENKCLVNYYKYILKSNRMLYEYKQASEQGASVVRRNLNMDNFNDIIINLPSIKEQE